MKEFEITFSVSGTCTQTIQLADDCPYTPEQVVDSLEGIGPGNIVTTANEGGDLIDLNDDLRVIGKVVQSLIEGEYSDFESTGTDDFTAQLEQTISRLNSNLKIFRWFMYARFVDEKGMIGLFLTQEAPTDDEIKQLPLFVNAIGDNQCGFARLLP